jgi:hypothetical protein
MFFASDGQRNEGNRLMSTVLQVAANVMQLFLAACVVAVMIRNKAAKRFPWFFVYACFQVVEGIFRWLLFWKAAPSTYYHWYWRTALIDTGLLFLALGESWLHVFRIFFELVWFRVLVATLGSVMLGYCWWAVWTHPRQDKDWVLATILQLDLTFTFVIAVASLVFFWLVRFFGVAAHEQESGVILGFMVESGFSLAGVGFRTVVGPHSTILGFPSIDFAAWVPVVGYLVCEFVWLLTFLRRPTGAIKELPRLTPGQVNEKLGEYLQILGNMTRKK